MKDKTIEIVGVLIKVALVALLIVAIVPVVGKVFKWAGGEVVLGGLGSGNNKRRDDYAIGGGYNRVGNGTCAFGASESSKEAVASSGMG